MRLSRYTTLILTTAIMVSLSAVTSAQEKKGAAKAPKLSDVKIVSVKKDPNRIEFSICVNPGKAPVTGKRAILWFSMGSSEPPVRTEVAKAAQEMKEGADRTYLNFSGPGFIAVRADMEGSKAEKDHWITTVNFGDIDLGGENIQIKGQFYKTTEIPMSFVLWDEEYNLSNEVRFTADVKSGKIVKMLPDDSK
jgi:hypothetical protein